MRQAAELSREALIEIVETLQGHLYLDLRTAPEDDRGRRGVPPNSEYWNPDKSWSIDLLDSLADKLRQHRPGADRDRALRNRHRGRTGRANGPLRLVRLLARPTQKGRMTLAKRKPKKPAAKPAVPHLPACNVLGKKPLVQS